MSRALLVERCCPQEHTREAYCYHGKEKLSARLMEFQIHPTHAVAVEYETPLGDLGWAKRGRFPICPAHREPGDLPHP